MLSRVFISDEHTRNIKCTKCSNYLSVPPIVIYSNNPICGRCVTQTVDVVEHRAYFYEDLAKFMFFSCMNDIYGCPIQLPWGKVMEHEIGCGYGRIICPAVECESKIASKEITRHFEVKHQHLILKQNQHYLSQFSTEYRFINKLFIWNNLVLIIQTTTVAGGKGDVFFRISNFKEPTPKTLKIIFNSKSSSICLNKFAVMKYDSKFPVFARTEIINISALKQVLGSDITCMFKFDEELQSKSCELNNDKLLSEIECPICTEYMKPPIYMCHTGHSLCGKCKQKLLNCPSCFGQFSDTRNYSLERITDIIAYPCRSKDQGCDFAGNVEDIAHHEALCSKSLQDKVSCLANQATCKWKGQYSEVFRHIVSAHSNFCFYLGCPMCIDADSSTITVGFFEYNYKVFKVYIDWNKNKKDGMRWAITCIKDKHNLSKYFDKYIFYLDFVNENRIFMISNICHRVPATAISQNCLHFVNIPFHQIKPYIKENKITFKLNIVKY